MLGREPVPRTTARRRTASVRESAGTPARAAATVSRTEPARLGEPDGIRCGRPSGVDRAGSGPGPRQVEASAGTSPERGREARRPGRHGPLVPRARAGDERRARSAPVPALDPARTVGRPLAPRSTDRPVRQRVDSRSTRHPTARTRRDGMRARSARARRRPRARCAEPGRAEAPTTGDRSADDEAGGGEASCSQGAADLAERRTRARRTRRSRARSPSWPGSRLAHVEPRIAVALERARRGRPSPRRAAAVRRRVQLSCRAERRGPVSTIRAVLEERAAETRSRASTPTTRRWPRAAPAHASPSTNASASFTNAIAPGSSASAAASGPPQVDAVQALELVLEPGRRRWRSRTARGRRPPRRRRALRRPRQPR